MKILWGIHNWQDVLKISRTHGEENLWSQPQNDLNNDSLVHLHISGQMQSYTDHVTHYGYVLLRPPRQYPSGSQFHYSVSDGSLSSFSNPEFPLHSGKLQRLSIFRRLLHNLQPFLCFFMERWPKRDMDWTEVKKQQHINSKLTVQSIHWENATFR